MVHAPYGVVIAYGPHMHRKKEKLARIIGALLASCVLYAMAKLVELGTGKYKKRYRKQTTGRQRRARGYS